MSRIKENTEFGNGNLLNIIMLTFREVQRLCDQLSFGGTLFDIASIPLLKIAISRDIGCTFALISFLSFDIPLALLQKKKPSKLPFYKKHAIMPTETFRSLWYSDLNFV